MQKKMNLKIVQTIDNIPYLIQILFITLFITFCKQKTYTRVKKARQPKNLKCNKKSNKRERNKKKCDTHATTKQNKTCKN